MGEIDDLGHFRTAKPPAPHVTRSSEIYKLFYSPTEKTFQFDKSLPDLPVPLLATTLRKYLESVKPHVTDEEFRTTERLVEDFQNGVGKVLHEMLEHRAKTKRNWLQEWWEKYAYLMNRASLTPLCNMTSAIHTPPGIFMKEDGTMLDRAAYYISVYVDFWNMLRTETMKPDKHKEKPWSMQQWSRMYNTIRLPGEHLDTFEFHFKTESQGKCPGHVIVLCNGHVYSIQVVLEDTGRILSVLEIRKLLQNVWDIAMARTPGPGVGTLTCDDRSKWYKNRMKLMKLHPQNVANFSIISSALFVVVLDQRSPNNFVEVVTEGLLGNIRNRWAEKSLQLIVFQNGLSASSSDHSPADAIAHVSLAYYIYLDLELTGGVIQQSEASQPDLPRIQELDFTIDSEIEQAIEKCYQDVQAMGSNLQVEAIIYHSFGKNFMKSINYHPDAFIQLALQLAYYRIHKKQGPTYETASTRQFYNGRTETVRTCTIEAVEWVRNMLDVNADRVTRRKMMEIALNKHVDMMTEAQKGGGCDRHLLGLYILATEHGMPIPEIYQDPAYVKSGGGGNFILSTSLVGYTPMRCGCVSPMCQDGYGIFYSIQDDRVSFTVSTWRTSQATNSYRMCEAITMSMNEMQSLSASRTVPMSQL